jgi:ABC transporter substrate binding protein
MDRPAFLGILTGACRPCRLPSRHSGRRSPKVAMLLYGTPQTDPNGVDLRPSLRDVGYLEERNLLLDYRFAEGKPDRLPELAADLVRQKRDVIVSLGGDVTPAAQQATRSIPIVMNDAVQAGLGGLARPGSNLTGVTLILDTRAGNNYASPESASRGIQSTRPRVPAEPSRRPGSGCPAPILGDSTCRGLRYGLSACGLRAGEALIVVSHAHDPPEPENRRLHGKASRADGGEVVTAPTRGNAHRSAAEQRPFQVVPPIRPIFDSGTRRRVPQRRG